MKRYVPDRIGDRLARLAALVVEDGDRRARKGPAGLVDDVADDRAIQHLTDRRRCKCAEGHGQHEQQGPGDERSTLRPLAAHRACRACRACRIGRARRVHHGGRSSSTTDRLIDQKRAREREDELGARQRHRRELPRRASCTALGGAAPRDAGKVRKTAGRVKAGVDATPARLTGYSAASHSSAQNRGVRTAADHHQRREGRCAGCRERRGHRGARASVRRRRRAAARRAPRRR